MVNDDLVRVTEEEVHENDDPQFRNLPFASRKFRGRVFAKLCRVVWIFRELRTRQASCYDNNVPTIVETKATR